MSVRIGPQQYIDKDILDDVPVKTGNCRQDAHVKTREVVDLIVSSPAPPLVVLGGPIAQSRGTIDFETRSLDMKRPSLPTDQRGENERENEGATALKSVCDCSSREDRGSHEVSGNIATYLEPDMALSAPLDEFLSLVS